MPAELQTWQAPLQGELQQIPSGEHESPAWHCALRVQVLPPWLSWGVHVPLLQK
jgi:hypothetical protein